MAKTKVKSTNTAITQQNKPTEDTMAQTATTGTLKFKSTSSSNSIEFLSASKMEVGQTVQGEYVEALPSRFDDKKKDIKLEEVDNNGNKTGKTIVLNAAGNLGARMANISLGSLVQIVYLGQSTIKKGRMAGKKAHNFDVLTAE